jgi:hypothetical protein
MIYQECTAQFYFVVLRKTICKCTWFCQKGQKLAKLAASVKSRDIGGFGQNTTKTMNSGLGLTQTCDSWACASSATSSWLARLCSDTLLHSDNSINGDK